MSAHHKNFDYRMNSRSIPFRRAGTRESSPSFQRGAVDSIACEQQSTTPSTPYEQRAKELGNPRNLEDVAKVQASKDLCGYAASVLRHRRAVR